MYYHIHPAVFGHPSLVHFSDIYTDLWLPIHAIDSIKETENTTS